MSSTYETGHARNVASLLRLNQTVATFGATYNPSNNNIKTTALATLYTNANTKVSDVNNAFTNWKNATNTRQISFEPLNKFATQLLGALQSTGAPQQTIDDFVFQVNQFRASNGAKLTKADAGITEKLTTPNDGTPTETEETKHVSTSHRSYDNQLQHFSKMILLLQSVPNYNPNEVAFKVTTLQTQLTNLTTANNNANVSYANLKASRIQRNTFLYAKDTGMLDIAKQVKAYVKSVYGASSQEYLAVNAIRFTRVVAKKKAQ